MKNIVKITNHIEKGFHICAVTYSEFEIKVLNPFKVGGLFNQTGDLKTSPEEFLT
jgi:hypothetical protein